MKQNIEFEYETKTLVTKEQFEKIVKSIQSPSFTEQVNYYFDNKERTIISLGGGLRVRLKNNKYKLTLKMLGENQNVEYSQIIKHEDFISLIEKGLLPNGLVKETLDKNNVIGTITKIGELTTSRFEFKYKEGLIALDRNLYSSKEDYEIECEASSKDESRALLIDFLKKYNIVFVENFDSKMKRALS